MLIIDPALEAEHRRIRGIERKRAKLAQEAKKVQECKAIDEIEKESPGKDDFRENTERKNYEKDVFQQKKAEILENYEKGAIIDIEA
jgi:hypothetical protein